MVENGKGFELPLFVRGDIDGFFGLLLDNLVQFLVASGMLVGIYGMPAEIVFGRIFPGAALSILLGNAYYFHQARKLAIAERRSDVCALPYGLNTPSLYAFIFLVIAPVWAANREALGEREAAILAWHVCLAAAVGSGLIELIGSSVGGWVRRVTPRAALLATLAGIAISLIAMPFIINMFAHPLVSFLPLAILLATYFGKLRLPWAFPGGLAAVATGAALAWLGGLMSVADLAGSTKYLGFLLPRPAVGEMISALDWKLLVSMLPVIIPMGLINAMGTLQNVESAEAAGDSFPVGPTMAVNGAGTLLGAVLGSCFPTTVYIGHPGWKALGSRAGYSLLNGVTITVICLTGGIGVLAALVPPESAYPILLYIGVMMTTQAFEAVPKRHFPAVCIGLIPPIAAWGLMLVGFSLTVATGGAFDMSIADKFLGMLDFELGGLMNLAGGFLFSAMFLTAITVHFIDQNYKHVIYWCVVSAVFAYFGLIHSGQIVAGQFTDLVAPGAAWKFSVGYGMIGAFALHYMLRNRREKRGAIDG